MTDVYVSVLGATTLERGGAGIRLTPLTTKLLLRLVAAEGEAVASGDLYTDLWGKPERGRITRAHRTEVQKRVLELRRALEPAPGGADESVLRTEQMLTQGGQVSAYRLVLGPDRLDVLQFTDLFHRAAHTGSATATMLLNRALGLWRGRPLGDVADAKFARPLVRRLTGMYEAACAELIRTHTKWDRPELALPVAKRLVAQRPDDEEALATLQGLWARLRERNGAELLRHEFPRLRTTVVVKSGDLFEETDASLVAGFGDTFDTATEDDLIISRGSVQGQLLHRVFDGDRVLLDRELRKGLRPVQPVGRESARDKPRGKRLRYPIGTVVPVPLAEPGRRVFAVAYSRQGLDLVARSTPDELRVALDRLWESVAVHGLLRPVALPLVGSGLARVTALQGHELIALIADTFLRACRDRPVTPELRVVLRPEDLRGVGLPDVARYFEGLDGDGRRSQEAAPR
ncbi:bacterial transcriptional activator domain-containing protein [Streptomyces sp. NBC_00853]|uniref:macro domain-containing protein n=1 Tax=Streptomyces sp. NBC_00853 TaxID=2903681 RepID=UPI003873C809|nr:bacterial transcriptional activator domain-containing protein [Streptomyces sp. NBC_00853]